MKLPLFLVLVVAFVSAADAAPASKSKSKIPSVASTVRAIIANDKTDLAATKLALDRLVDPTVQTKKALKQLVAMERAIRMLAGPSPTEAQKLGALRRYIYESGEWNDKKPFAYDLADPLGYRIENKLLTTYLATRKGNCVSMPVLFVILGGRLGLKVTLATAPQHILVKYTEAATGKTHNLEATSGGWPSRDVWYRQNMSMSDEAIRNGVYMRPLSNEEARALLAYIVMEHLLASGRFTEAMDLSKVLLEFNPNDVLALLAQGSASMRLVEDRFREQYPSVQDMPPAVRTNFKNFVHMASQPYRQAEALGWRETDGRTDPQAKTTPN
jgi:regulator of sirC expression with transglutaminase-like and TPR domain